MRSSYKARQDLLKFFLIDHALDCPTCDASGECQLQDATYEYGVAENPFHRPKMVREVEHFSDLIDFKHDRCVQCSQCIRTCEEVIGASAITMANRGFESTIIPAFGNSLYDTDCTHCGMCVQVCPVGALTDREYGEHPWEMQTVRSDLRLLPGRLLARCADARGRIKRAQGSAREYGVNRSYTCVKGRWGYDIVQSPTRLETPLIREGDGFREATWEEALTLVANRLAAYRGRLIRRRLRADAHERGRLRARPVHAGRDGVAACRCRRAARSTRRATGRCSRRSATGR